MKAPRIPARILLAMPLAGLLVAAVRTQGANTFTDSNWISLNPAIPGTDGTVYTSVIDNSGNLYIGGSFTVVGDISAKYISKWSGSAWSALGSGMNNSVSALVMLGGELYAGG